MRNDIKSLIQIKKDDAKPAVELLVKAFRNYPLLQYYYPIESNREKITNYFLSFVVYSGIKYGEVYATSSNLEGIAIWMPSKNYPIIFWKMLRSVPLSTIFSFGRHGGSIMSHFSNYLDGVHQRLVPFKHWFLQTIDVSPKFQGKCFGSKLLRSMFSKIDKEYLSCYLETIDEKNFSIFERFCFEIIDKSIVPKPSLLIGLC